MLRSALTGFVLLAVSGCSGDAQRTATDEQLVATDGADKTPDSDTAGWKSSDIAGWSYDLISEEGEIAGFQFNDDGSVVATVGQRGHLNYPTLFWKLDSDERLLICNDRDYQDQFSILVLLSVDNDVVTARNNILDRVERYFRKRTSHLSAEQLDELLPDRHGDETGVGRTKR